MMKWEDYFMEMAEVAAKRSKDPSTQVGAIIASPDNRVVGTGYNGFPNIQQSRILGNYGKNNDELFPWGREGEVLDTKYLYVVHAELNAILQAQSSYGSLKGCSIYATLFPCNECAKAIVQSGISKVYYKSDKYADLDIFKAARRIFDICGVELIKLD